MTVKGQNKRKECICAPVCELSTVSYKGKTVQELAVWSVALMATIYIYKTLLAMSFMDTKTD